MPEVVVEGIGVVLLPFTSRLLVYQLSVLPVDGVALSGNAFSFKQ